MKNESIHVDTIIRLLREYRKRLEILLYDLSKFRLPFSLRSKILKSRQRNAKTSVFELIQTGSQTHEHMAMSSSQRLELKLLLNDIETAWVDLELTQ